jgi:hypothetical protein
MRHASDAGWAVESRVRSIAGAMVLAGLGLALLDARWLWLVAFVGANLLQSGLTGWCLLSNLLAPAGRQRSA